SRKSEGQRRRLETDPFRKKLGPVPVSRVVEGGSALHSESHASADGPNPADELMAPMPFPFGTDRHVIGYLADAVKGKETGHQDIGLGPVELLRPDDRRWIGRRDLEASADPVIQNGAEDARGIEAGKAEPIDRAVHPDERGGME